MASLRFGKHPPKIDYRTLRFRDYLTAGLPAPPDSYDVLAKVYANLNISDPTTLFPMDGNDTYGDCTIAALAHAITVYNGLISQNNIMALPDIVKLYMSLTGGIDSGLNELTVLNYWQSNLVDGDQIIAFASIDPRNHTHVQQAIQLFGGVYLGFQVQQNCMNDFSNKVAWTPGTLTTDGHAVYAVGYDANNVTVLTWGTTQQGTWAWWDECVDEAYVILPSEAKSAGFSSAFNFDQLQADLNQVAN
jgi:hypothetical protein